MSRNNTKNLREFNNRLAAFSKTFAIKVAAKAATAITALAVSAYQSGTTVYGEARPVGKYGKLSLYKTGKAFKTTRFTSDGGSKIRAVLSAPYVKYLIGKYKILPCGNQALPWTWLLAIQNIVNEEKNILKEAAHDA